MGTITRIREGDTVRITAGKNAGLEGTVLNVHNATLAYEARAFVEVKLTDGPHRTYLALQILEKVDR